MDFNESPFGGSDPLDAYETMEHEMLSDDETSNDNNESTDTENDIGGSGKKSAEQITGKEIRCLGHPVSVPRAVAGTVVLYAGLFIVVSLSSDRDSVLNSLLSLLGSVATLAATFTIWLK